MRPVHLPIAVLALLGGIGCVDKDTAQHAIDAMQEARTGPKPDIAPMIRNRELPFRYPAPLYAQKLQGNVTLHLRLDTLGGVIPESTKVAESSGNLALDSAAWNGARLLSFTPATLKGRRISVAVQLPVHFRHPQGGVFPADTAHPNKKTP